MSKSNARNNARRESTEVERLARAAAAAEAENKRKAAAAAATGGDASAKPATTSTDAKPKAEAENEMPGWFKGWSDSCFGGFAKGVSGKLDDHEERLSKLERAAGGSGGSTSDAGATTTEAEKPKTDGTTTGTAPSATETPAGETPKTETGAATDKGAKLVPAEAYRYRYWDADGNPAWGGPLMDIFAAKQAGGGVTSNYEPIKVWYNSETKTVVRPMTPEEITKYFA